MTDKTEAQPESLRLAAWLNEGAWHQMRLGDVEAAGRELRRQHAEIQQLKAQRSARQAVPDGWRLVPKEATRQMLDAMPPVEEDGYWAMYEAALSAAPPPPEREPLNQHDLERLVGNWFAEGWAKKAAFGMLDDYELTRNRSHQ